MRVLVIENYRSTPLGQLSRALDEGGRSGLAGLERILTGIDGLGFVHLTGRDVVRHRIVAQIVDAYERDATDPGAAS